MKSVNSLRKKRRSDAVAILIVLAFIVLLAGVVVAYLSRTSTDRQIAHGDFHDAKSDQLARSALDLIVADLKQEIVNGSIASTVGSYTIYTPASNANMVPMRSGNPAGSPDPIPNLVRRSIRSDAIAAPGVASRGSAVNSATDPSLNTRSIPTARWNKHFLISKANPANDKTDPVASFTAPDWVIVTKTGPKSFTAWDATVHDSTSDNFVLGRYGYAVFDEGGLLDLNIAGYPTGTTAVQSGRKGSAAFADLAALPYPITNTNPSYQVDRLVGWRNYATTQPANSFPGATPPVFADNFRSGTGPATSYFSLITNTSTGFLTTSGNTWNTRTDQFFVGRQELIDYFSTTGAPVNALQYLGTFSRELNAPSFAPATPTTTNPDFMQVRVTTSFTRLDGTVANVGEPLVKRRFPLSRLAWVTYNGPSAAVYASNTTPPYDPVIANLLNAGVSLATIQQGTAANIQNYFGLTFVSNDLWTYAHGAGNRVLGLTEVAAAAREPDFFEFLQASISTGSLGENTGGGVTGGSVFPDIHMANTTHHILSIGAAIIDQSDPDSIPTRIQFSPSGPMWTCYGIESLPYITQVYPIAGTSPNVPTQWATYLLFQLWNPHQNIPAAPQIRLRVDGGLAVFTGGNGQIWSAGTGTFLNATGQSILLNPPAIFSPSPAPLLTSNATPTGTTPGTFALVPTATPFVGFRLPDFILTPGGPNNPRVMVQFGASPNPFNVTMEVDVGGGTFVPYNHFVGINDQTSWINGAPVGVRDATSVAGNPRAFTAVQLTQVPPSCFMKSDPRATRFGVFQMDTNPGSNSRIMEPLWSSAASLPNGYGGTIADPGGPVEHAPLRFAGNPYYPATLCINNAPSTSTRTSYTDTDGVIRPADNTYPDPTTSARLSTPYYAAPTPSPSPTPPPGVALAFNDYQPVILNRSFRNVAELGYAFRDLPWKTLDFFTDGSADAALLDIFTINQEPSVVAGRVNLNTRQTAVLESILGGAILDELDSTNTISRTGSSATAAPVLAANIVTATSTTPLRNRADLLTRPGLPTAIFPVPASGAAHDQRVKARREVVQRAVSTVTQTRTWNLMIDVIAESGRYPPTATTLSQFVVEGEKRYWLHVAIDRFTGEVIDQQLEAVYE